MPTTPNTPRAQMACTGRHSTKTWKCSRRGWLETCFLTSARLLHTTNLSPQVAPPLSLLPMGLGTPCRRAHEPPLQPPTSGFLSMDQCAMASWLLDLGLGSGPGSGILVVFLPLSFSRLSLSLVHVSRFGSPLQPRARPAHLGRMNLFARYRVLLPMGHPDPGRDRQTDRELIFPMRCRT